MFIFKIVKYIFEKILTLIWGKYLKVGPTMRLVGG